MTRSDDNASPRNSLRCFPRWRIRSRSHRPRYFNVAPGCAPQSEKASIEGAAGVLQSARSSKIEDEHDGRGLH